MSKAYEIITNTIIDRLENGIIPWKCSWVKGERKAPVNMISKKAYRGINVFLLGSLGYSSPYFLTYKQAILKGGRVRKGEKGCPVIYWSTFNKKTGEKDEKGKEIIDKVFMLKHYTVFNVTQCDDIEVPEEENLNVIDFNSIEECEKIVNGYSNKPEIHIGKGDQRAYYSPSKDFINMPLAESFDSEEEFYGTLFHEMAHSTGHKTRLDRESLVKNSSFGSHEYSKEELVAEFTSAFLCGEAGILSNTLENSSAYIQGWVAKLRNDNKLLISAASQASKACDHVLGVVREYDKPAPKKAYVKKTTKKSTKRKAQKFA